MNRPSIDKLYLSITRELANMSTCCKKKTGALIVKNERIISSGYNGVPSKIEHCCDFWHKTWKNHINNVSNVTSREVNNITNHADNITETTLSFENFMKTQDHHSWSLKNEVHAEHNCILWAAKEGISIDQSCMYSLYSPCIYCAKAIASAGIERVVYERVFERDPMGIQFLNQYGIECIQIKE